MRVPRRAIKINSFSPRTPVFLFPLHFVEEEDGITVVEDGISVVVLKNKV